MISSRAGVSGRTASAEEARIREKIALTPDRYTDAEIAKHGMTGRTRGRYYDNNAYKVPTHPVDEKTPRKIRDNRDNQYQEV